MIRKISYQQIDFNKYQKVLDEAIQDSFYAQKKLLDQRTYHWEILVYEDYEAVMPIPFIKKFGIKIVLMPLFLQQLGIFSKIDRKDINDKFLNFFKGNYNIRYYAFNAKNEFDSIENTRKNYIISPQPYPQLRKKYFKGRKSTVKSAQFLEYRQEDWTTENKDFVTQFYKGLDKKSDAQDFFNYINFLDASHLLEIHAAYKNSTKVSLVLLVKATDQYKLLSLVTDPDQYKENGASFLIDKILQDHIAKKGFDFMGGNISRGIEVFFKSFGAELETYPVITYSNSELLRRMFTKR